MGYFVKADGSYYEGDLIYGDTPVTQRPSSQHVWDGGWVLRPSIQDYDIAIERHLDHVAELAGYYDPLGRIPNIDRACSYAGFENPYQQESQRFVAWRASIWSYVYEVKSQVEAGQRAQPTIDELIAELPAY